MTQPPCAQCGRPIHDVGYVCYPCGRNAADRVGQTIKFLPHVVETITRQDRLANGTRSRAKPQSRPPSNLGASQLYGAAKGELGTWARHVAEERGQDVPDSIAGAIQLLSGSMDWLRYRPEAQEAFRAILDACRVIERLVDNQDTKILVGWCPCQTRLYARRGSADTSCTGCGTQYDVTDAKAQLLNQGRDVRVTSAEAADILVGWDTDLRPQRERCRKLIDMWHFRGLITDDEGYLLGEVCDRWTNALAARVA